MKYLATFLLLLTFSSKGMTMTPQEKNLVLISAHTATTNLDDLKKALEKGLNEKLTINQINEALAQLYAYCGFPRSLQGISTFMEVVKNRKEKGLNDGQGKEPSKIDSSHDVYERGRKTLEKLTKTPQSKPAPGFGEFNPLIDRFLKEHLFGDIFDRDVLNHREREIVTIAALASMDKVEPMLQSHMNMGLNVGVTSEELQEIVDLTKSKSGKAVLEKVLATKK